MELVVLIEKIYNKLRIDIREKCNPLFSKFRIKKLKKLNRDTEITIISNNCWGAHVYRFFGIPYNSPTIGLFMYAPDFIKFIYNIKEYVKKELVFIKHEDSIHHDELVKVGGRNATCPIAKCGDIEIIFLHYNSPQEAKEKWERRVKRINWNNMLYKFSEMNNCTEKELIAFDKFPEKKKVVFVTRDYGLQSQVIHKKFFMQDTILDDTTYFRDYVNLYTLVSGTQQ